MTKGFLISRQPIECRGGSMREFAGFQGVFCNPYERYINPTGRKLNLPFAIVELLDFMVDENPGIRALYNKQMLHFINPVTGYYDGHYGDRISGIRPGEVYINYSNQFHKAFNELKDNINSRRAVIVINNPMFENYSGNDICCTLSIQFLLRNGELHCIVTMRSEDIYLGYCYDTFQFQIMQELMASLLGVKVGRYFHNVGSLHLYTHDDDKLLGILNDMSEKIEKFKIVTMRGFTSYDSMDTQLKATWCLARDSIAGKPEDARANFDSIEDPYLMQCAFTLMAEGCRRRKEIDRYYYWRGEVRNEFQDYFSQMATAMIDKDKYDLKVDHT